MSIQALVRRLIAVGRDYARGAITFGDYEIEMLKARGWAEDFLSSDEIAMAGSLAWENFTPPEREIINDNDVWRTIIGFTYGIEPVVEVFEEPEIYGEGVAPAFEFIPEGEELIEEIPDENWWGSSESRSKFVPMSRSTRRVRQSRIKPGSIPSNWFEKIYREAAEEEAEQHQRRARQKKQQHRHLEEAQRRRTEELEFMQWLEAQRRRMRGQ